ncbi:iron-containing alcohol dehydrogenase family protein [Celerinatantimonas yamalensis]|uniref:Iron-containing alcohol dehydrogenase family protein n=1 Tax=Celerinatantimonas yamalensis TaxID=559956 RepID=A0ABW9GAF6_9GAMM
MSVEFHLPSHYIRGANVARQLVEYCQRLGPRTMVIGGHKALQALEEHIGVIESTRYHWFGGECSVTQIERLKAHAREQQAQVIVAVGGGKAMDTGKAVADELQLPIITIPTIVATCAALTPLSVRYLDSGHFLDIYHLSKAPDVVLVDTTLLAHSPLRWLAAGLGDTLAKWYEYRSLKHSETNLIGHQQLTAFNSRLCYDLIERFGAKACQALEQGHSSEALEQVCDAIILNAGMTATMASGVHSSAAHALYNGFTVDDEVREFGHGLLVGYGNLVLLALEGRSDEQLLDAIRLAQACYVPISLAQIKANWQAEQLQAVFDMAVATPDMHQLPFSVSCEQLAEACQRVDALSECVAGESR